MIKSIRKIFKYSFLDLLSFSLLYLIIWLYWLMGIIYVLFSYGQLNATSWFVS